MNVQCVNYNASMCSHDKVLMILSSVKDRNSKCTKIPGSNWKKKKILDIDFLMGIYIPVPCKHKNYI